MKKAGKSDEELASIFAELNEPPLLQGTEHLMSVFAALSNSRSAGFNGPLPIGFLEIKSYCELMDETLTPWEVETIRAMDSAFLDENYRLDKVKG